MKEEEVLEKEQWIVEAKAVIDDVKTHVKEMLISDLEGSHKNVYINITTKENQQITVEMSAQGFMIVGHRYNCCANPDGRWFETPYALLNKISPGYQHSFGNDLREKLLQLQNEQNMSSIDPSLN